MSYKTRISPPSTKCRTAGTVHWHNEISKCFLKKGFNSLSTLCIIDGLFRQEGNVVGELHQNSVRVKPAIMLVFMKLLLIYTRLNKYKTCAVKTLYFYIIIFSNEMYLNCRLLVCFVCVCLKKKLQEKISFFLIRDTVACACGCSIEMDTGLSNNDSLNERFQRNRNVEKCLRDTEK